MYNIMEIKLYIRNVFRRCYMNTILKSLLLVKEPTEKVNNETTIQLHLCFRRWSVNLVLYVFIDLYSISIYRCSLRSVHLLYYVFIDIQFIFYIYL